MTTLKNLIEIEKKYKNTWQHGLKKKKTFAILKSYFCLDFLKLEN